jgi:hypothetical protein
MKGRNAAKTFQATRAARFSESRAASEAQREAARKAGTRRTMMMVNPDDVREGDEVATATGFRAVEDVDRSEWVVVNGETCVQRFVKES